MPKLSSWFDKQLKSVFGRYINPNRAPTLLVWSILIDETPNNYFHEQRFPDNLPEEDQIPFAIGSYNLNEWATDFATRVFIRELGSSQLYHATADRYNRTFDFMKKGFSYSPTAHYMKTIENTAQDKGINFTDTLLVALFQHDSDKMDYAINKAEVPQCRNLNELAVKLGRMRADNNATIASFLGGLLTPKDDKSQTTQFHKRFMASSMAGGRVSRPGIAEVVLALPIMAGLFAKLLGYSTMGNLAIPALFLPIYGSIMVHEVIHAYSEDDKYFGLIPCNLILS